MLNGDPEEKRNPGKSLAPIIAILAFTIVMTVVALTLHSLLNSKETEEPAEPAAKEAAKNTAQDRFRREFERGVALHQNRKFADAYKIFSGLLAQVNAKNDSGFFDRAELELYCAVSAAGTGDRTAAEAHFRNASEVTSGLLAGVRAAIGKLLAEAEAAGHGKETEK